MGVSSTFQTSNPFRVHVRRSIRTPPVFGLGVGSLDVDLHSGEDCGPLSIA